MLLHPNVLAFILAPLMFIAFVLLIAGGGYCFKKPRADIAARLDVVSVRRCRTNADVYGLGGPRQKVVAPLNGF